MPRHDSWDKIEGVTPHVECVDECNDPFNNGSGIIVFLVAKDSECDCQTQFDENEGELDPKGCSEYTVFSVVDSKTLVFCANEDSRDNVTGAVCISKRLMCKSSLNLHENDKTNIVRSMMIQIIPACQNDESNHTGECSDSSTHRQDLLCDRSIMCQGSSVSQPAFRSKDRCESDDSNCAGSNEKRLQLMCSNI